MSLVQFVKDLSSYHFFRINTLSLAVFRICVSILILVDVVLRSRNLVFFYTDEGVAPRSVIATIYPEHIQSIHFLSGEPSIIGLLFVIQFISGVFLLVGYKTRFNLVLSFILLVSVDIRNPLVTSYADSMFRLVLLWAIFLPLGEKLSIDSILSSAEPRESISNIATVFILLQIIFIYFLNGLHKTAFHEDWLSGEVVSSILHYEPISFFLAPYIRELPFIFIQIGEIIWYLLLPLSFLLCIFKGRKRYIFASIFIIMHLILGVSVRVGAFSFVAITCVILFIQSQFWVDATQIYQIVCERVFDVEKFKTTISTTIKSKLPQTDNTNKPILSHSVIFIIVLILGLSMTGSNIQTAIGIHYEPANETELPIIEQSQNLKEMVRLNQPSWGFFETRVGADWFIVSGVRMKDGTDYDILNDRPLSADIPYENNLQKQFDTYRHRFYYNEFRNDITKPAVQSYVSYNCDRNSEITHFDIYIIQYSYDQFINPTPDYKTEKNIYRQYSESCDGSNPIQLFPDSIITEDRTQ